MDNDDNTPFLERILEANPPGGLVGLAATLLAGGWEEVERHADRVVFAKGEERAEMHRGADGQWFWTTPGA